MYPSVTLSAGPYPNSALSAGQIAILAVVVTLSLSTWLVLVFVAAREPRHGKVGGTISLPQQPGAREQGGERPEREAA